MTAAQPRYRWVIVAAAATILALSMGSIVNGFSAYLLPLEETRGWTRSQSSAINFAGLFGLAFGGVLFGRLADRHGSKRFVFMGISVLGLSYLMASQATALWQFYAIFALGGLLGAGAIYAPVLALVSTFFTRGGGLAMGLVAGGQAVGQGLVPYASALLIERIGVPTTLALTGAAMLVALLPLCLLLTPPPAAQAGATTTAATDYPMPANRVIATMSLAVILCCTCMAIPLMHLVPLVQAVCGVATSSASGVLLGMLLVAIIGRIAFGDIADRIGALPAYMCATGWMTVMVYGFMVLDRVVDFRIYAMVYGFGYAGVMTAVLVSIRVLIPPQRRAAAMGTVGLFAWMGHAVGGLIGGVLHDLTGDYHAAFALAAVAGVLNLSVVFWLYTRTSGQRGATTRPA